MPSRLFESYDDTIDGSAGASPSRRRNGSADIEAESRDNDRRVLSYALVLVGVGVAVYASSFSGVLLFDDIPHIVDNAKIHSLWPPWDLLATRRAVLNVTLAVNYALHGLDVWGYHLVNVAVHLLAGLTLFGLVRRTLLTARLRARFESNATRLAFFTAMIWLVHPLCTQSVTYIVQRGESLMGLFYLLTLYALARGDGAHRRAVWYGVAVFACALGMASKAVMVTAPVVALLYDRTFLASGFVDAFRQRWRVHAALMASWGVLFALGIVQTTFRTAPNPFAHVGFSHTGVTPCQYLATQPGVLLHYLRLAFWPVGLCLDYKWPVAGTFSDIAPATITIVMLVAAAIVGTIRRSSYGFVMAAFFLILLPTSSFIPIKDLAFEHRMYLPLAAIVVLAVCGVHGLVTSRFVAGTRARRTVRRIAVALGVAVSVALGIGTVQRNRAYRSEESMWRDVAETSPENPRAYVGVGAALYKQGSIDEALTYFRRALALEPNYADAWFDVGAALETMGDVDGAVAAYEQAVRYAPQRHNIYDVLAHLLSRSGRFEEAAQWYKRLTELEPHRADWFYELGNALSDTGRTEEAIRAYHAATNVDPAHVDSWINLGNALRRTGAVSGAIAAYQQAVERDDASTIAWLNLANSLAGAGRTEDAVRAFGRAVALDPTAAAAHASLGWALLVGGRTDEAMDAFTEALALDPRNGLARRGLSELAAEPPAPAASDAP